MKLNELLAGTGLICPESELEITGVSRDSRRTRPGELFVAMKGQDADGHRYVRQAVERGARAVLVQEGEPWDREGLPTHIPVLEAEDSRAALAAVAANWYGRPGEELTLIGITGTNGKTTVTTLIKGILEEATGEKVGLIGTNEVRVGERAYPAQRTTPESDDLQALLREMADEGCRYVVMEVSSHALCLSRVAALTFAVGGFTNLTQDHLDFHGTMEAYRQAKGRLWSQCKKAVINVDDAAGRFYAGRCPCPVMGYGRSELSDLRAEGVELLPHGVRFLARGWEERAQVELAIPGEFSVSNALCALGCVRVLGVSLNAAAAALKRAGGVKGRMEVVPTPGAGTVVIDYAHTPDALKNALTALRPFTKGRLICLFGCGGNRDRTKRPQMGAIAGALADVCVVTSDNPRSEDPLDIIGDILAGMEGLAPTVLPDRAEAIALALGLLEEGDTLLLAGKGHETYQEVDGEKRHMDEREIIANFY